MRQKAHLRYPILYDVRAGNDRHLTSGTAQQFKLLSGMSNYCQLLLIHNDCYYENHWTISTRNQR